MREWVGKVANWRTITTTLVLAAATWGWTVTAQELREYQRMKKDVQINTEQRQQNAEFLKLVQQIAVDVQEIKQRQLTVQGKARVETLGEDESYMKVNATGRAADYQQLKFARITNLSAEEQPSVKVKVIGVFRHVDADYVVQLSHRAGQLLGADEGDIRVRVEPVQESE